MRLRLPPPPRPSSARHWPIALASVVGLLALAPGASAMTGTNLVVNGDGETPVGAEWVGVAGGLERNLYAQGGYPGPVLVSSSGAIVGSFAGGSYLLNPTGSMNVTENRQTITLTPDDAAAIDTGTVRSRLSAFLGGYATQNDRIGVVVVWRDAAAAPLLTQSLAPVTVTERGNTSGFLRREDLQAVPAGARSAIVTLNGTRAVGPAHDGYLDDLTIQLIGIPQVQKSFSVATAPAGTPVRLTYAIANSEDQETKPPWSFADELPPGLTVASTARASTTCRGGRLVAGGGRVTMAGSLDPGQPACTAALDVTSATEGSFATGPEQLGELVALRAAPTSAAVTFGPPQDGGVAPPAQPIVLPPIAIPPVVPLLPQPPAPEPVKPSFLRPALRVAATPSSRQVRAGATLRLRVRVTNPTTVDAVRVRVCQTLPDDLEFVSATTDTPEPPRNRRCWAAGRLAAGDAWTVTVTVRGAADANGRVTSRVTASSPDAVREAATTTAVRIAGSDASAAERGRRAARRSARAAR